MEKNEEFIRVKIMTYFSKQYDLDIEKSATFNDLKQKLLDTDGELPDFNIIYNGRTIRNAGGALSTLVKGDTATFYINAAQVHGGCYKRYD